MRDITHKHNPRRGLTQKGCTMTSPRCSKCGDTTHIEDSSVLPRNINVKRATSLDIYQFVLSEKASLFKNRKLKVNQLQAGIGHVQGSASYDCSDDDTTSEDSFCLQIKIKWKQAKEQRVPKATHLITNVAYRLQPHHHRNLYLRARLDTCADVNLMPASMYQLVLKDPKMQKLTPSNLQVGTYTTDSVKIVGSCKFHLVHPDTKRLLETTLYVAMNDGSVLLSCKTTLLLGLIQPRSRLDYLPPRASLKQAQLIIARRWKRCYILKRNQWLPKENNKMWLLKCQQSKKRPQAHNKQRDDHARVHRCLSRDWQVPGTRLPYPAWSKQTSQADTLSTNSHTSKRPVPARNRQDATGRSTCSSTWS